MGRRAVSLSTLGRATTAARGVSRTTKETEDVARAEQRLQEAQSELREMESELNSEIAVMQTADAPADIDTLGIKAKRGAVDVRLIALAWKPVTRRSTTSATR
jgi:hypothetical protein